MDKTKPPKDNAKHFANRYHHMGEIDLECVLEDLDDMDYLSAKGKKFRTAFWEMFIKE